MAIEDGWTVYRAVKHLTGNNSRQFPPGRGQVKVRLLSGLNPLMEKYATIVISVTYDRHRYELPSYTRRCSFLTEHPLFLFRHFFFLQPRSQVLRVQHEGRKFSRRGEYAAILKNTAKRTEIEGLLCET